MTMVGKCTSEAAAVVSSACTIKAHSRVTSKGDSSREASTFVCFRVETQSRTNRQWYKKKKFCHLEFWTMKTTASVSI